MLHPIFARPADRLRRLCRWLADEDYLFAKLLGSSAAGIFAIALLAVIFVAVTSRQRSYEQARDLTLKSLRGADKVENDVDTLDRSLREYLLTGGAEPLTEFRRHEAALRGRLTELASLMAGNPGPIAAIERTASAFTQWAMRIANPQIAAREKGRDASVLQSRTKGIALLAIVRGGLADFSRMTASELEQINSRTESHRILQIGGCIALSLLATAFLLVSSAYSFTAYRRHVAKVASAQAQTRSIIDSALDAVVTIDGSERIASINPAGEKMFGHTSAQLLGAPVSLLIRGSSFADLARSAGNITHTASGSRCDGADFPVEFSLSEMLLDGERRFVVILRDITERRRTEETLKNIGLGVSAATGEEFVKSLVQQLSRALRIDFAFVVELPTQAGPNPALLTLAEDGALHSIGAFDLTHTACEEVLARGFRASLHGAHRDYPRDSLLVGLAIDGFVAMPLLDHAGRAIGAMGVLHRQPLQDTQVIESTLQIFAARAAAELERKRFEEDLEAEKNRLAVTLRSIGEGFITIDNDGHVLMLNPIAERLTGWSQEEAAGRLLPEIFHLVEEHTRTRCSAAIDHLISTGTATELAGTHLILARGGSERLIETTAAPIRDKSRRGGSVLICRDVTERARADEERRKGEKLDSLGIAAGGIAHDFNNLLTAILGNLSLALYTRGLDETLSARLVSAKKASLRAQQLAEQLLTFARGGAPITASACISELVQDTVTFSLHGSNIRLESDIPVDLWPAEVDAGQISQVITNLTINAAQAMPAGGTLRVACANITLAAENSRLGLRAGRYVKITLQDEGIGIPEEHLKKIFDPYFSTKPKGSGLGLATAYSIVKSHEGVIDVVSHPGEGTTFYLFLRATEKPFEIAPDLAAPAPAPHRARVLILDDEEDICALVACALEPLGYEVIETTDALSAIDAYQKAMGEGRPFDLVISDLTIPGGMGGQEAVRRLHEIDPEVKAIVSSGYAMDPIMSRFRDYGFCGMIAKPYEIDALGRVVAEVLAAPLPRNVISHEFAEKKTA